MRWPELWRGNRSWVPRFETTLDFPATQLLVHAASSLTSIALLLCVLPAALAQQPGQPSATQPPQSASSNPRASVPPATQPSLPAVAQTKAPELGFVVVLDPAHGGQNDGAMLQPASPEKNYTLAFAVRLHVVLRSRGIRSVLTRDSDTAIDNTARAEFANRAHASACVLLHATATGTGIHLFTSSLPPAPVSEPGRAFLPWRTAQASFETQSLRLESDLNAALTHRHISVLLDRTSLMPLDSMACPAVAVEIAAPNPGTPLTDASYQEQVAEALASGLAEWRADRRTQP